MKTNSKLPDYARYQWTWRELLLSLCQTIFVMAALAYSFYRSIWALFPLCGLGVVYFRRLEQAKLQKKKARLLEQFKECILSVSTMLQAGYSLENAFIHCTDDITSMFGINSDIHEELAYIRRGLNINISIEDLLLDFGNRSCCEDIVQFANIVAVAKHSGGNLTEIIGMASHRIGRKIELQQEIRTILSGRRMELGVMKIIPFGILLYINLGTPGYFDTLYHNLTGIAIMTLCLMGYIVAIWLGDVVMKNIEGALVSG